MTGPTFHGNRPIYSASTALATVAESLSAIKSQDRLTFADLGAVLGKSEDQAAKYCDGSATMDFITFGRAKREWNGRFTGAFDRLCVDSRPATGTDRSRHCTVLKAALAIAEALEDDDHISPDEVRENRAILEGARDAINDVLGTLTPRALTI